MMRSKSITWVLLVTFFFQQSVSYPYVAFANGEAVPISATNELGVPVPVIPFDPTKPPSADEENAFEEEIRTTTEELQDDYPLTEAEEAKKQEAEKQEAERQEAENKEKLNYEYERYEFEDAVDLLRPEFATAVIVKDLSRENLETLTKLDIEVGMIVLHGEIVLFTSGNENELGTLPAVKALIDKASFMSHTHPGEDALQGPSYFDIQKSVEAPKLEWVVSHENAYAYNQDGVANGGRAFSHEDYLEALSRALWETAAERDQMAARGALNLFIAEQDRYNETPESERITLREGGALVIGDGETRTLAQDEIDFSSITLTGTGQLITDHDITVTGDILLSGDAKITARTNNIVVSVQGNVTLSGEGEILNETSGKTVTLSFTGSGDQVFDQTNASNQDNLKGDLRVEKAGGAVVLNSNLTLSGKLSVNQGTFSPGAFDVVVQDDLLINDSASGKGIYQAGAGSLTVEGFQLFIGGGDFLGSTGTVDVKGRVTLNGNGISGKGTFRAPSTTMRAGDHWIQTGGTFDPNGGTVIFDGSAAPTIRSESSDGPTAFYDLVVDLDGGAGLFLNDSLEVNGTLTVQRGTLRAGSVNVTAGNLVVDGGTLRLNGNSVTYRVTGDVTISSGTLNAPDSTSMFVVGGNWTRIGGTFNAGSGTVTFDGAGTQLLTTDGRSFASLTHSGSGTLQLRDALTVTTALNNNAGTFDLNGKSWTMTGATFSNDGTVRLQGDETITGLTQDIDSGTWKYVGVPAGVSGVNFKDFGEIDYFNVIVNLTNGVEEINIKDGDLKISSTLQHTKGNLETDGFNLNAASVVIDGGILQTNDAQSQVLIGDLTITGGGFYSNGLDISVSITGVLTLSGGGDFNAPGVGGSFLLSGDLRRTGGRFNHSGGTLTLDGTNQTVSGTTTFNNLEKIVTSADTLTFEAGSTQTILGTLTLKGADADNLLSLRSTVPGIQFKVDPQSSRDIAFLDVMDSNNLNATAINCTDTCLNSRNNTGWLLPAVSLVIGDGETVTLGTNETEFESLTLTGSGQLITDHDIIITGDLTLSDTAKITAKTNDVTVSVQGNVTLAQEGEILNETSGKTVTLKFTGTNDQTLDQTNATGQDNLRGNLLVDKTSGTVTLASDLALNQISLTQTLTVTQGTFDANGKAVTVQGITEVGGGTYEAGSGLQTFEGGLTVSAGSFNGGTGNLDLNGDFTLSGGAFKASSNLTSFAGNFTHTAGGTFDHNGGTVKFDSASSINVATSETFNHLTFGESWTSISNGDTLIAEGNLTFEDNAQVYVSGGTATIEVKGNVVVGDVGKTTRSLTVVFQGTADQTLDFFGGPGPENNFTINKESGTVRLISDVVYQDGYPVITVESGTLNLNGHNLNWPDYGPSAVNALRITGGKLTQGGGSITANKLEISENGIIEAEGGGLTVRYQFSNAGTVRLQGNESVSLRNNQNDIDSGTFEYVGDGVGGSDTFTLKDFGATDYFNLTINATDPNEVFRLNAPLSVAGEFKILSGRFDPNGFASPLPSITIGDGETVILGANTQYASITITGTGRLIADHDITVTGNIFLSDTAIFRIDGTVSVEGNVTLIDSATLTKNTAPGRAVLRFTGSGVQNWDSTGTSGAFESDITINKSGGAVRLVSDLVLTGAGADLTVEEGTLDLNGFNLTVNGATSNFEVESGGNLQLRGTETINLNPEVNNGKPDLKAGSTVIYTGDGEIVLKDFAYKNLTIDGPGTFKLGQDTTIDENLKIKQGVFDANGKSAAVQGGVTVEAGTYSASTNTQTFGNLLIQGGNFNAGAGQVNTGSLLIQSTGVYNASSGALSVVGGSLMVQGTGRFNGSSGTVDVDDDVVIQSGGTLTAPRTLIVGDNWTNQGGVFISGANEVIFDGSDIQLIRSDGDAFSAFIVRNSDPTAEGGLILQDALTVTGDLEVESGRLNTASRNVTVGDMLVISSGTFKGTAAAVDIGGVVRIKENGTLIAPSGDFTVGGNWMNEGGTFTAGSGTVTFTGSGGTSLQSGGDAFNNILIEKEGGSFVSATVGGDLVVNGTLTVRSGNFLNGALIDTTINDLLIDGGTMTSDGDLVVTGDVTLSTGTFIAPPADRSFMLQGDFSHDGGTFNHNGGTVTLSGINQTLSGDTTFNNLTKTVTAAVTLTFEVGSTQTILGTLTLKGADADNLLSLRSTVDGQQFNLDPQGTRDIAFLDVKDSNNIAAVIDCTDTCANSGNNSGWFLPAQAVTVGDGQSVTLDPDVATVDSVTTSGTGTLVSDHDFTVTGDITLSGSGGIEIDGTLTAQGDVTLNDTTTIAPPEGGSTTVTFTGDDDQTLTLASPDQITGDIIINKGSGTLTLESDLTVSGDLTLESGTLDLNGHTLIVTGVFTVKEDGVLKLQGTESVSVPTLEEGSKVIYTGEAEGIVIKPFLYHNLTIEGEGAFRLDQDITVQGDLEIEEGTLDLNGRILTVGGDFKNNGSFVASSGTVILDGEDQKISGDNTFFNLTKIVEGADTLTFEAGSTQTILGMLTLKGGSEEARLSLRSDEESEQFELDPRGGRDLEFLDVKDSENINETVLNCFTGCVDSGNNAQWDFIANAAPVANAVSVEVNEDNDLEITLTGSDLEGDTLTFNLVSGSETNGTIVSQDGATVVFRPNLNFNGSASLRFTVSDGTLTSDEAEVSITVNSVNDPPVLDNVTFSAEEGETVTGQLTAIDIENDTLTFSLVEGPSEGEITFNPDGSFTFVPEADFNGTLTFTFQVSDGNLEALSPATVTLNLGAVNDPPTAQVQSVSVNEDNDLEITLTGSDLEGDTLTFNLVSGSETNGTIVSQDGATVVFRPNLNFNGSASLRFTVSDGTLTSDEAEVSITVNPVNDPPVALVQSVTVDEDNDLTVTLTVTDVDSTTFSFAIVRDEVTEAQLGEGPPEGAIQIENGLILNFNNQTGTLTFRPNENFSGTTSFQFVVKDSEGLTSDEAQVSITVDPVNDAPAATVQSVSVNEDTDLTITLAGSDVDNDTLTFSLVSGSETNGQIVSQDGSTVVFRPTANFNGTASLRFTVSDGTLTSDEAEVSITVNSVNDPPVAGTVSVSGNTGATVTGTVTGTDIDGDSLTYFVATAPTNGTLQLQSNGAFSYVSNAGFSGNDSFSFGVSDGTLQSVSPGTATITVNPAVATTTDSQPGVFTPLPGGGGGGGGGSGSGGGGGSAGGRRGRFAERPRTDLLKGSSVGLFPFKSWVQLYQEKYPTKRPFFARVRRLARLRFQQEFQAYQGRLDQIRFSVLKMENIPGLREALRYQTLITDVAGNPMAHYAIEVKPGITQTGLEMEDGKFIFDIYNMENPGVRHGYIWDSIQQDYVLVYEYADGQLVCKDPEKCKEIGPVFQSA